MSEAADFEGWGELAPRRKPRTPRNKRTNPPDEAVINNSNPVSASTPVSTPVVVSRRDVEGLVVTVMGTLGQFVDESFNVLDPSTHKLLPHADKAIDDMLPWMQKYGAILAANSIWLGFGMALVTLVSPGIGPTTEIIAGVRKPRFARKGPDDILTPAAKAAMERGKLRIAPGGSIEPKDTKVE